MPVLNTYKSPLLGIWKISESWPVLFDLLINKETYYPDLEKIQSEKRKQEWLAARLLLQHLTDGDTPIRYHKNGAPFLPDSEYRISISHTQGFAAVLLSKSSNPGIDIEYHSERAWRLRKKYMNEGELTFITSLCDHKNTANKTMADVTEIATLCWCAKETAYKALGETAVDFAGHLCIEPFSPAKEGVLILNERRTKQKLSFKIDYQITKDFILAIHA